MKLEQTLVRRESDVREFAGIRNRESKYREDSRRPSVARKCTKQEIAGHLEFALPCVTICDPSGLHPSRSLVGERKTPATKVALRFDDGSSTHAGFMGVITLIDGTSRV
jgi:hypothetical protein